MQLNKNLDFVILVGTEESVPTFYVETKFSSSTPSDIPYFLLGNSEDLIPDVLGARFPVDNVKDLRIIINKIEYILFFFIIYIL